MPLLLLHRSLVGSLVIGITLASACSSSDGESQTGGDSTPAGAGHGGSVGNEPGNPGTGGSSQANDGCSLESDDAACNSCLHTRCLMACVNCSKDGACLQLLDCLVGCSGSGSCQDACESAHPAGAEDLIALMGASSGCVAKSCAAECGAAQSGADGTGGQPGTGGSSTGGSGGTGTDSGIDGHSCSVVLDQGTGKEPNGSLPVCCGPTESEKAMIEEVFVLLNEHRASNGVAPLTHSDTLEAAVQGHCLHMSLHTFFDHMAPESSVNSPWDRARLCGDMAFGENIAMGQTSAAQVMAGWKASPGHNKNMLNATYKRVGIGHADGYWGQLFGQ